MYVSLQTISALLNLAPIIAAVPSFIGHTHDNFTRLPPSISTVQQELGRRLSRNASIYFPGSPGYINDTERWAPNTESNFSFVVVPGIDRDVVATVSSSSISPIQDSKQLTQEKRSGSQISTIYHSLRSTKLTAPRRNCRQSTMALKFISVR